MSPKPFQLLRQALAVAVVIAVASVASLGSGAAPAAAADTYSISGTVFLGTTATPAGAGEVLVRWNTAPGLIPPSGVLTDATGAFTIPGLSENSYYIWYEYKGVSSYPSVYHPGVVSSSSATRITVLGANVSGVNGVVPAPGALTGMVTAGDTGLGYGDAEVTVYRVSGSSSTYAGGPVHTDAAGNYSIPGLLAGSYRIRVTNVGTAPLQSGFFGSSSSFLATATQTTFGGAPDTAPRNVALTPLQTITGTVTLGAGGSPAGAGEVRVSAWYRDSDTGGNVSVPDVYTNSSGVYSMQGLTVAASYSLGFTYVGTGLVGYSPVSVSSVNTGTATTTVRSPTLSRALTIAGTVRLGEGGPLAGAGEVAVTLKRPSYSPITLTTGADGSFVANTLDPGTYTISLHYTGSGSYPDLTLPAPVVIPASATDLAITMPQGAVITGQVTRSSSPGFGISDTTVVAHWIDPDSGEELAQYSTLTDEDGVYELQPVGEGWYWVEFYRPGYAYQTYGGASEYYEPTFFEVSRGINGDIDAALFDGAEIKGFINAPSISDFTAGTMTVEVLLHDGSSWIPTGHIVNVPSSRRYSINELAPDSYRLRFVYNGAAGYSAVTSPTLTLVPGETRVHDSALATPAQPLAPGVLVKGDSSSTVYIVDSPSRLVPIADFATLTDGGHGTTVVTVPQARIETFVIASTPLSNLIQCGPSPFALRFLTQGGMQRALVTLFGAWEKTYLSTEACATFPFVDRDVWGDTETYLGAPGGQMYRVGPDGVKHAVVGRMNDGLFHEANWNPVTVNANYLNSLPTGRAVYLPGAPVKLPNGSVYLIDGIDHAIPVASMSVLADFGLSTSPRAIPADGLENYYIDPLPLSNLLDCEDYLVLGSGGAMRVITAPELFAGLPRSYIESSSCGGWRTIMPAGALFLRSPSTGSIYHMLDGEKQPIYSMNFVTLLNGGPGFSYWNVSDTYLDRIPTGYAALPLGAMIKPNNSASIYMVLDRSTLIPVSSFGSLSDMGLSTAFTTVSPAAMNGRTTTPQALSNVIRCNGELYISSQNQLWKTSADTVGVLPVTDLTPAFCAAIYKNPAPLTNAVFVKSASAGSVYRLHQGTKIPMTSWGQVQAVAGANPIVILAVNDYFLNLIPVAPPQLFAGQLIKSASDPSIYMFTGSGGVIPIASFETVAAMGLPTSHTVVPAQTLTALSVAPRPLGALVKCGSDYWIAAQGALWKTSIAALGSLPLSELPDSLCAAIPMSPTTLSHPVMIKGVNGATLYSLSNGVKRPITNWGYVLSVSGGQFISASDAFLAAIPTGPLVG